MPARRAYTRTMPEKAPAVTRAARPPAQLNGPGEPEASHAWIVAYAPVEDPKYVVAVMLKGTNAEISASTGGRLAGPIAKAMLDEAFRITPPFPTETAAPPSTAPATVAP